MTPREVQELRERAKELRCLYRVHEIVSRRGQPPTQTFLSILEAIPDGWQRPEATGATIEYLGRRYVGPGYASAGAAISESLRLHDVVVGLIEVTCAGDPPLGDAPVFLDEEKELLRNIAHRIGEYLEWKHTELLGDRAPSSDVHWRWREGYAQALAAALDAERFGVAGLYLGGSTEAGAAGPGSDIDLYVDFRGTDEQRQLLSCWLEGWSLCLSELAYRQTGSSFRDGILNVHWLVEPPDPRHFPELRALGIDGHSSSSSVGSEQ